jgi:hypothetical protein
MAKFTILDENGQPTPDSPFPSKAAAEAAAAKREAHDSRVGYDEKYDTNYTIVEVK